MDDESECDWNPPIEVGIVESELFQIPSGLPSIEDFLKAELEKDDEKPEIDGAPETTVEIHKEDLAEVAIEEGSLAEEQEECETAPVTKEDIQSEDDFEIPQVEVKKSKITTKKQIDESFGIDTVKIDFGSIEKKTKKEDDEKLRLHLINSTNNFIEKLIEKVVDTCEYEDPDDILRARLDKNKLCEELDNKMFQLDIEQKIRLFLNRKTVEYFRRKKATRPLIDDSPDNIVNNLRKYRESLMMVNSYKGLEESTKSLVGAKKTELQKLLRELEAKSKEKAMEFVNTVKKVLDADTSEKMEALIENLTRKMRNMQKEISKVRYVLIQRQHTMAVLQEKAKKLDDLGNGFHMVDFEHLQTETQALGKKIEERNNELNRLHCRCNADINILAHIREKQHMLRSTIEDQQEAFDELLIEKQNFREYLNQLKIKRGSVRREFQTVSFQNGLLDKPELLIDFDVTEESVIALQEKIASMKAEKNAVDKKLKQIIEILPSKENF